MQQQSQYPSHTVSLFGRSSLTEIPHMYSWFEEMRSQHPAFYDERTHLWQAFGYQDNLSILTDYNRFSSQAFGVVGSFLKDTLVAKDPPDHRKLRNLVNQAFTPRAVAHMSYEVRLNSVY